MPKYKSSVRCKTKKIKLTRKTIGARAKSSYIPSHAGSSDTNTVFPSSHDICTENSKEEGTAYTRAKRKELSLWDTLKDQVLEESHKSSAPFCDMCSVCKKPGVYRCLECSRSSVFCKDCVYTVHINSLHLPEKWNKTCYEAAFQQLVLHLSGDHSTHVVYSRDVKTFVNTDSGSTHQLRPWKVSRRMTDRQRIAEHLCL